MTFDELSDADKYLVVDLLARDNNNGFLQVSIRGVPLDITGWDEWVIDQEREKQSWTWLEEL